MGDQLTYGRHTAFVYNRGGARRLFQLGPLTLVRWHRERDDISTAEVVVPTAECCLQLDDVRTILNELHIYRNDKPVWEGPITRIEYDWDHVRFFAEDVLWQTKRSVINPGYNFMRPAGLVLDAVDMLLNQAYSRQRDPWNMLNVNGNLERTHLHAIRTPGEPKLLRMMHDWQDTVWNDVDKLGEDHGIDYTVVNRDVYYWDLHWAWKILPPLQEHWISDPIRVVEYGNQLFTRAIVTNGRGYAGVDQAGDDVVSRREYGFVDKVTTNANEADSANKPSEGDIREWQQQAGRSLTGTYPPPLSVVVPDNVTLLATCEWPIEDLIPGAWFQVTVERLCRQVTGWQRLQSIAVEEAAPRGEVVNMTSLQAPREMHRLP